jgi:hypothetical protein
LDTDEDVDVEQGSDLYRALRKLKELHDDGILSEAEHEGLKQRGIPENQPESVEVPVSDWLLLAGYSRLSGMITTNSC